MQKKRIENRYYRSPDQMKYLKKYIKFYNQTQFIKSLKRRLQLKNRGHTYFYMLYLKLKQNTKMGIIVL